MWSKPQKLLITNINVQIHAQIHSWQNNNLQPVDITLSETGDSNWLGNDTAGDIASFDEINDYFELE